MVPNFNLKAQCGKEKDVVLGNCQKQCLYIAVSSKPTGLPQLPDLRDFVDRDNDHDK